MSMTRCSANSANGGITPKNFTVKTVDIFKYLDFGSRITIFYLLVKLGWGYVSHTGKGG